MSNSSMYCDCDHLTDFAGMNFPSTPAELAEQFTEISFNTFSLDDVSSFFTSFDVAENKTIFAVVVTITVLNFVTLIFAHFRLHRRLLVSARAARKQRRERRQKAQRDFIARVAPSDGAPAPPASASALASSSAGGHLLRQRSSVASLHDPETSLQAHCKLEWASEIPTSRPRTPAMGLSKRFSSMMLSRSRSQVAPGEPPRIARPGGSTIAAMRGAEHSRAVTPPSAEATQLWRQRFEQRQTTISTRLALPPPDSRPGTADAGPAPPPFMAAQPSEEATQMWLRKFQQRQATKSLGTAGSGSTLPPFTRAPRPAATRQPPTLHRVPSDPVACVQSRLSSFDIPDDDDDAFPAPSAPPSPPIDAQGEDASGGAAADAPSEAASPSEGAPPSKGTPPSKGLFLSIARQSRGSRAMRVMASLGNRRTARVADAQTAGADDDAASGAPNSPPPTAGSGDSRAKRVMMSLGNRRTARVADAQTAGADDDAADGASRPPSRRGTALRARMAKLRVAAEETGKEASQARRLARERQWSDLAKLAADDAKSRLKRGAKAGWHIARTEHSIISFLYPADVDTSGTNLSDEQMVQIFWNTMIVELALLAVLHSPSDAGASIQPLKLIIEGLIVVGPCVACAVITRCIFRWGNRGRKLRLKRER